jgi:hippurate hydrolase
MNNMLETIKSLAHQFAPECIAIRQHLHAHPELSYEEFETAAFIKQELHKWGIPFQEMAKTGVVALIEGNHPSKKIIALRADIDALPIREENKVPYQSKNPGVMHACGHDVHTSCLLGAARILKQTRNEWEGTIKLIFQPGEEKNPGGASLLIKEGVLENPAPEKIFALHVHPGMEVGKFSFRGGMVMASADEIYISIKSNGGHAAAPQLTADTILIASQLVVSLQQIISRNNDPFNPSVLSITSIQGGNSTNVIPSEVKLMGTLRAMNETWRFKSHELIINQTHKLVEAMGASADVRIDVGYPFVLNNEALSAEARKQAEVYAGKENVTETELRMGAEDFAYYSHLIPACFFRLGAGNKAKNITANVHTPIFNVDESCIEHGMGMMAWLALTAG